MITLSSFQATKRRSEQARAFNKLFFIGSVLLIAGLSLDSVRGWIQYRRPVNSLIPDLSSLRRPVLSLPDLTLSEDLFSPAPEAETAPPAEGAAEPPAWKLKGVLLSGAKRALLEDAQGQESLWVTEGQRVKGWKILRIQERSVLFEQNGVTHEIPM